MHSFHLSDLSGEHIALSEEEAGHALRVLRLRDGDAVMLVDGRGTQATALLQVTGKHRAEVVVQERTVHPPEPTAGIHIAVAPTKQMDRFEWFLEKATEIGVGRITPLLTARTERAQLRQDRLLKVLVSAMKQSQRTWLPLLDALTPLDEVAGQARAQRYFGWCEGEHAAFTSVYTAKEDVLMLIGPEGDFTPEEAAGMRRQGFQAVNLGPARLRTETAAIAACTWMSLMHGQR
jgi:16S rRNA (uracil1498-N3)-methyltransferase